MSQRDLEREIFGDVMASLLDAGLASAGTYAPPGGGASVPVVVRLQRGTQLVGEFAQSAARRDMLVLQLAEVTPELDAVVTVLDADGLVQGAYRLRGLVEETEAHALWEVRRA